MLENEMMREKAISFFNENLSGFKIKEILRVKDGYYICPENMDGTPAMVRDFVFHDNGTYESCKIPPTKEWNQMIFEARKESNRSA